MLSRLIVLLALMAGTMSFAADAKAERRVALVIGNAAYANAATLRNPRNDANDMAAALKKLNFEVVLGLDLDQQSFATTIEQFARMLDYADVALMYYAGHGLQINEKNYLVSVNAKLNNEFLLSSETIDLESLVRLMEAKVPVNLIFLDACRNNPLADDLKKNLAAMRRGGSIGRGLARIEPTGRDTLIAFAAAPGQEAADGNDRNSPFASALLKQMPQPNLEVSVMLKAVAAEVRQVTRNAQRPQQISDMTRTFYFANAETDAATKAGANAPKTEVAQAPVNAPRNAAPNQDDRALDIAWWNSAQQANECDAVRAYMQRFPNGIFVELAKLTERRLCVVSQRHVTVIDASPPSATPSPPTPRPQQAAPPPAAPRPQQAVPAPQPAATPAPRPQQAAPAQPAPAPAPTARVETPSAPQAFSLPGGAGLTPPAPTARPAPPPAAPVQTARPEPRVEPAPAAPAPLQQQAAVARPLPPAPPSGAAQQANRDCDGCPEMVNIPGGSFAMGSNDDPSERPIHEVSIRSFSMSRYPVSIGEWKRCVAAKECKYQPPGDDNLPAYNLSWNDTQQYVAWLSKTTGQKYRLPSEAEWEYAARAKTQTKFWWGNLVAPGTANCKGCGSDGSSARPLKVGAFPANAFGLHDMTGSIAQWMSDCWIKDYQGAPRDGSSRELSFCRQHVVRGGSWKNDASYARSSSRDRYDTDVRYIANGFRVVRQ